MPVTIKHAKMAFKDPKTNEYVPIDALSDMTTAEKLELIRQAGETQVENVNDAGETQVGNVNSAGTTQVGNVNTAGTTQVWNVNSAGTTQVGNVNTAGANQISAIQAKGEQTLETIPEDYTELYNDIDSIVLVQDDEPEEDMNRIWIESDTFEETSVPEMEDLEEVEEEVTELKSALKQATGVEEIAFVDGKYVYNDETKVYLTDIRTSSTGYKYAIVECGAGDVFTVSGTSGNSNPIAWAFTTSDGTILKRELKSVTVTDKVVTAPADSAYLVINAKNNAKSYKGQSLNTVVNQKLDVFTNVLFDKLNKRIGSTGAIVNNSTDDAMTDYILCEPGQQIVWQGQSYWYNNSPVMLCLSFFDENKAYIDGSGVAQVDGSLATTNQVGYITTVVPAGAVYVVGSCHSIRFTECSLKIYNVIDRIDKVAYLEISNQSKMEKYYDAPYSVDRSVIYVSNKKPTGYSIGKRTDYIPCASGDVVKYSGCSFYYENNPIMYCVAFFADDQTFISGVMQCDGVTTTVSTRGTIETIAPEGTAYVVASINGVLGDEYFHVYSYERTLMQDVDKRRDRKNIVKKIKMARHMRGNYNERVTFLHFSDLHKNIGSFNRIVSDRVFFGEHIDDIICTGDMVEDQYETAEAFASWWNPSVLICIGNHDVAKFENGEYDWTYLSMADRAATYIAPFATGWGITQDSGKSYFYKDYAAANLRLIVLDVMLYNLSGSEASVQETWLSDLLADSITNNKHVLIACHSPHGGAEAKGCSFSRVDQTIYPTYTDCNTPQAIIDIVAEKITSGLHFCGYIVGHTHQDNIWVADAAGKQLMYCVTTARSTGTDYWKNSDQHRDDTLDAYNVVTIDTRNTLVKIIRGGGADMDDHMRPRKMICFNYSTGEIVGEET